MESSKELENVFQYIKDAKQKNKKFIITWPVNDSMQEDLAKLGFNVERMPLPGQDQGINYSEKQLAQADWKISWE